jgi:hypothetical protein
MTVVPTPPASRAVMIEARKEHRAEVLEVAHQRQLARYEAEYQKALTSRPSVGQQLNFSYNTIRSVHKLVFSPNLPSTAWKFAKLSISHDTRKIGMAYIRAFLKGDGHTLDQLANTKLVKNIGHEYTDLAHSPDVKKISRGFTHFGEAVAKQFNHLFGL